MKPMKHYLQREDASNKNSIINVVKSRVAFSDTDFYERRMQALVITSQNASPVVGNI